MKLREFFYIDKETLEPTEDRSYDATSDDSVLAKKDKRKTRLTLKQIKKARLASEEHQKEAAKELQFVRQMYGLAANAEQQM
jgi:hypothetical protein